MSLPSMMLRKYKIYLLIFLFSFQQSFSQQSRNSLEKQRDNNLLKIEQAERIINETEKSNSIKVENNQESGFKKMLKTQDQNVDVLDSRENTGDLEKKIIDKIK